MMHAEMNAHKHIPTHTDTNTHAHTHTHIHTYSNHGIIAISAERNRNLFPVKSFKN